jgi:anhydro-N-acetylmuramic acid kinase
MLNWLFKTPPPASTPRTAIGLMSGTSLDGLDACVVKETGHGNRVKVVSTLSTAFPPGVRDGFKRMIETGHANIHELLTLEHQYTEVVAQQCQQLINATDESISVIGFHGQTLWHAPDLGSTLQIGFAEYLAETTGIPVAHQFRRSDMARGGQGAPLAPLFHQLHFERETENVAVLNLGGIANISLLVPGQPVSGWDIGPANTLSDGWHQRSQNQAFDRNGAYAASGSVHQNLLDQLLKDPYFAQRPPKSTGREYFSQSWLQQTLGQLAPISAADVQATLNQLTATLVHQALPEEVDILVVCGGGVHNTHLMDALDDTVDPLVVTSDAFAIDPDFVEAACFGWLGLQCVDYQPLATTLITGSAVPGVLGSISHPTKG